MGSMADDSLKTNLSNPARTYLWEAMFTNPIGGGDAEVLMIRCQSAGVPGRSVGEILVPFKQTPGIKFPGKHVVSHAWATSFIEGMDKKVFNAIHAWNQAIVHDRLGVGGPDVAIKSNIYLRLLNTLGEVIMKIKFVGCYPQAVDDVPLAMDSEAAIYYTVTWSFDHWEEEA